MWQEGVASFERECHSKLDWIFYNYLYKLLNTPKKKIRKDIRSDINFTCDVWRLLIQWNFMSKFLLHKLFSYIYVTELYTIISILLLKFWSYDHVIINLMVKVYCFFFHFSLYICRCRHTHSDIKGGDIYYYTGQIDLVVTLRCVNH